VFAVKCAAGGVEANKPDALAAGLDGVAIDYVDALRRAFARPLAPPVTQLIVTTSGQTARLRQILSKTQPRSRKYNCVARQIRPMVRERLPGAVLLSGVLCDAVF
jgi:hypothetical protein